MDNGVSIANVSVIENSASFNYTLWSSGNHTIKALYSGNNYLNSNNTIIVDVKKASVDLSINDMLTQYYSNPSNFTVNIISNGNGINEGKIIFYVNNNLIDSKDILEGNVNLEYVANITGEYNLNVVFEETDNYLTNSISTKFNVSKMPTTLNGDSVIYDHEAVKTFTTELKDDNNEGVSNQTVKLEVVKYSGESATFNGTTDNNGEIIFDVGKLAGGMWYVLGTYEGDINYINSKFADRFIVVRMNTSTVIKDIDKPYKGNSIHFSANIHDEFGHIVSDGLAYFYLDGKDIVYIDLTNHKVYLYTNSHVLSARNNDKLAISTNNSELFLEYVGNHVLNVVYEGTSVYRSSNQTINFTVLEQPISSSIIANNVNTVYNGNGYLIVTLKDNASKPITNTKLSINLNGVKEFTTDGKGQVKISTNSLAPKVYSVAIKFGGNSVYAASSKTVKVTVKKANPKLVAVKKTFKRSLKIKKYTVSLKTNKNVAMKKTKVFIKVKGITYSAYTNTKGTAIFKITKLTKKGKYTAVVTYKGDKFYNQLSKKVYIYIK